MKKQRILSVFLLLIVVCGIVLWKDNKREVKIEAAEQEYVPEDDYCSMEDLGEMDYYLFCNTQLHKDVTGYEGKPTIINHDTQTIEEAKELYQNFKAKLPLEDEEEENGGNADGGEERTEVWHISQDCKWVSTHKWNEFQTAETTTVYFEKEKVKERTAGIMEDPVLAIFLKEGETYKEADEAYCSRLSELRKESRKNDEYDPVMRENEEGDLLAGVTDNHSRLTVRRIEDGTEQWSFDLKGIRGEARKIREARGYEEDSLWVEIEQFEGNEQEGWLVVQAGSSSFFQIAYPSGEVTYLGEYLYSPCFSPDGKYLAYSSVDYDNGVGMEPEEEKQTPPPGIYVREVETGKTAYIYWNPSIETGEDFLEYRFFTWMKKESFEEYMADTQEE